MKPISFKNTFLFALLIAFTMGSCKVVVHDHDHPRHFHHHHDDVHTDVIIH